MFNGWIAVSCPEVGVIAPHSRRTFVPELDFRTTSGTHTTPVVTGMDDEERTLEGLPARG